MPYKCKNYSYLYEKCIFTVLKKAGLPVNKKDLIVNCDGCKNEIDCCWYQTGAFVK